MVAKAIFTYGSLMFAPVWQHVVAGRHASAPAIVSGYARYAVRGALYPGMVAKPGAEVAGLVYFDVGEAEVAALDAFEGEDYRRVSVTARLAGGESLPVEAYLFIDRNALSEQGWDPDSFSLQRFVDSYCN